jgi:hypothetical protein
VGALPDQPGGRASAQVAAGIKTISIDRGVGADLGDSFLARAPELQRKRRPCNKVAVIGKTASDVVQTRPVSPIIRIKSAPFTIVSLLKKKGMSMMVKTGRHYPGAVPAR